MYFAVFLSGFGDAPPGATTQPRANSGLIGWLAVLPYLMGTLKCGYLNKPLASANPNGIGKSVLEAGQGSRPIPRFAGRKDTLNPVTGVPTAGVQSVQVCQAMLLRRIFLPCPHPCLKYSQNTTL